MSPQPWDCVEGFVTQRTVLVAAGIGNSHVNGKGKMSTNIDHLHKIVARRSFRLGLTYSEDVSALGSLIFF